jgi:RNA polymerase sigma-70 factor (ECF subfamily)
MCPIFRNCLMNDDLPPPILPDLTIEQLLARQEEFVRLFAQHEQMIHGLIVSLVPVRDDAAEIFQETSLATWRKFAEFEPGTNFLRWACRIAEFEVRRFRSRRQRDRLQFNDELLVQIVQARFGAEEGLINRQQALTDCLAKLRDRDRQLLHERYGRGRQAKEIAAEWGRPADSIYKAIKRIRAALYECINRALANEGRS